MSALRFTITAQGVTQAVGTSNPAMSACAPEGVDEIDKFSVVPRVTDAQPPNEAASTTIPRKRIELIPKARPLSKRNPRARARDAPKPRKGMDLARRFTPPAGFLIA